MKLIRLVLAAVLCTSAMARAESNLYATGETSGNLHVVEMDKAEVAKLLPPGLSLADSGLANRSKHPVIFYFGKQRHVHWVVFGVHTYPNTLGEEYFEQILMIPEVKSDRYPGKIFAHVPRMFLSGIRPTLAGEFFNFNKRVAKIQYTEEGMTISELGSGRPLLSDSHSRPDRFVPGAQSAAFQKVKRYFTRAMIQPGKGTQLCSYFDWRLDSGKVAPVSSVVRIGQSYLPGLREEVYSQQGFVFASEPILTPPFDCSHF